MKSCQHEHRSPGDDAHNARQLKVINYPGENLTLYDKLACLKYSIALTNKNVSDMLLHVLANWASWCPVDALLQEKKMISLQLGFKTC